VEALVHVDVVHTVARPEAEYLVGDVALRAAALSEGVEDGGFVSDGPLRVVVQQVGEIVVGSSDVGRKWPRRRGVEQVSPEKTRLAAPSREGSKVHPLSVGRSARKGWPKSSRVR
jgi:hypothetical protein